MIESNDKGGNRVETGDYLGLSAGIGSGWSGFGPSDAGSDELQREAGDSPEPDPGVPGDGFVSRPSQVESWLEGAGSGDPVLDVMASSVAALREPA